MGSLFRVPVEGGQVEKVLRPFSFFRLQFHGEGLYFLDRGTKEFRGTLIPLKRLDVRTERITEVARIKDPGGPRGFSLSPDGRSILTTEMGEAKVDMMLVDDFR